jgi:cell division protein FtsB
VSEQKQKKQKNLGGCLLSLFIWIRGIRRAPLFSLINFFNLFPLFIYLIVSTVIIGWDWRLIVILPLGILFSAVSSGSPTIFLVIKNYAEMQEFLVKFNHCEFTPVSVSEFIEVIDENSKDSINGSEAKPRLKDSKLSDIEYFLGNHIRFIVVDEGDSEGPSLGTAVAYFLAEGSWIFLKSLPKDMTNLEKFIVLHEVGHTETLGNINWDYKGANLPVLLSLPIIAILIDWNLITIIIYFIMFLVMSWRYWHTQRIQKFIRFHDEVYADCFAFSKSKKAWFLNFPAEKIADVYCNSMQSTQADGLVKTDTPMTAEQAEVRRKVFINNIERLRQGEIISNDDFFGIIPLDKIKMYDLLQGVLIIILFIALGLYQANLTTSRFLIFSLLTIFLIIFATTLVLLPSFLAKVIDYEFEYKEKEEFSDDEQKQLDRMYKTRGFLTKVREKIQSKTQSFSNAAKNEEYTLAARTKDRLFLPEEVNLYVEFKPLKTYIFHDKKINYLDISHLIYMPEDYSVIVVRKDNVQLDLGVKLGDKIRPYFLKSKNVTITRTENREAVESIIVPFFTN